MLLSISYRKSRSLKVLPKLKWKNWKLRTTQKNDSEKTNLQKKVGNMKEKLELKINKERKKETTTVQWKKVCHTAMIYFNDRCLVSEKEYSARTVLGRTHKQQKHTQSDTVKRNNAATFAELFQSLFHYSLPFSFVHGKQLPLISEN